MAEKVRFFRGKKGRKVIVVKGENTLKQLIEHPGFIECLADGEDLGKSKATPKAKKSEVVENGATDETKAKADALKIDYDKDINEDDLLALIELTEEDK